MSEAVAEYLALAESEDQWIVNRFVCPASRLDEFVAQLDEQGIARSEFPVAAISGGLATWDHDRAAIERHLRSPYVQLETFELKLNHGEPIRRTQRVAQQCDQYGIGVLVEFDWDENLRESMALAAEELDEIGFKARCGAEVVPSPGELAAFIADATELGAALKFTQGLHAPVSHDGVYGFVNVLLAAALRYEEDLPVAQIEALLTESEAGAFELGARVGWRGRSIATAELEEFWGFCAGFGSCSVREPLDGLRALGWLDGAIG